MPVPGEEPLDARLYDTPRPLDPEPEQAAPSPVEVPTPVAEQPSPPPVAPPQFPEAHREPFSGLLYLGALTDDFWWLGHRFVIRTLTTGELLEVALACRPYEDTEGSVKAYQAAVTAACVISVDGQPLPAPLTTEVGDTPFLNRFRYVLAKWHPPVLDAVYERYYSLEIIVREVIEAMGNLSG